MVMSQASVTPRPLDRQALAQLRRHGFRCTPGRIATWQVLQAGAPGHLRLAEIHQRVVALGWPTDNTAVRRTVQAFTRCGLTHALAVPGPLAYGAWPPRRIIMCRATCAALWPTFPPRRWRPPSLLPRPRLAMRSPFTGLTLPGRCPGRQTASAGQDPHRGSRRAAPDGADGHHR